jgi:hypothetical protein
MSTRPAAIYELWLFALGFSVWCSALVIAYVLHATGCAFHWSNGALRLGLSLTVLVALALVGSLWRHYAKNAPDGDLDPTGAFLQRVIVWTLIAAFVTIVFTLGPTLLLTTCT